MTIYRFSWAAQSVTVCATLPGAASVYFGGARFMQSNRYTARTGDLVVQELGDELLIYDQRTDIAHCLTATAALVWRACEGGASHDDLVQSVAAKGQNEDPEALVIGALDALDEKGLLASRVPDGSEISRRQAIRRMAGVGAAAFAAPFVVSAAVPSAQAMGSPPTCRQLGQSCSPNNSKNTNNDCCTADNSVCYSNTCTANCTLPGANPGGSGGCGGSTASRAKCCSNLCSTSDPTRCA